MEKPPIYSVARLILLRPDHPIRNGVILFALLTAVLIAGTRVFGGIPETHPYFQYSDGEDFGEILIAILLNFMFVFAVTAHALLIKQRQPENKSASQRSYWWLYPLMALFGLVFAGSAPLLEQSDIAWNPYNVSLWWWSIGWHRIATWFIGWEGGMMICAMLINADRLNKAAQTQPFDLFDRTAITATARQGLFNALIAILLPATLTPFLVDPRYWILFAAVMGIIILFSLVGLMLPSLGLRKRIVAAKANELEQVAAQIIAARQAGGVSDTAMSHDQLARLNTLLDYQAHIQAVPEWPFDRSVLARYGIYLLIPLGTWTGGAIVENIIDGFLG